MKHPWSTTFILLGLFVVSQIIGLWLLQENMSLEETESGLVVDHKDTVIGAHPQLSGWQSVLYVMTGVLLGTVILLVLIKFGQVQLWKVWFLLAVFLAQAVAFGVFLPGVVALVLSLILALLKVYKPGPVVHNLSEMFLYAGIAILLVPILDIFWMLVVLLLISLYDMWAVWHTKHMVQMAEFQKGSKVFAGLMVPKSEKKVLHTTKKQAKPLQKTGPSKGRATAILGGGDIAFPLLFSGTVLQQLAVGGSVELFSGLPFAFPIFSFATFSLEFAFLLSLLITFTVGISLFLLFYYAEKSRYYPAMPFVSAGCVAGLAMVALLA